LNSVSEAQSPHEPLTQLHRILYVEDDEDIREVVRFALEAVGGFSVLACESAAAAFEAIDSYAPQLIMLDVMMPQTDGPAMMRELRLREATRHIPVVFMTAKVQPQEFAEFLQLGVIDVVAKPFDPMTLPQTIASIWSRVKDNTIRSTATEAPALVKSCETNRGTRRG
jgi:CheY-like chemotaxis protein